MGDSRPNSYLMELIKNRTSIRKYLPQKVDRDIINQLLLAAQWAPSSQNTQSWRYIVFGRGEYAGFDG